jgi:NADPH-dependent 2,4-dienoyl-CoA reductase/sulfur reductase-like enzyme
MTPLPIVILGAGPAGMAAAEAASGHGQSVVLVDENAAPGGQIWRGGGPHWRDAGAARLWDLLRGRPHVRVMCSARVVACPSPHTLLLDCPDGPRVLPWQRLVICSGARELLLPFPGWTLPGVTGAGGLQALIKGGMPVAGKRVVVAGTGPLLLAVAETVRRSGGEVVAIAEHRNGAALARFGAALALRHPAKLAQAARLFHALRGVPYLRAASVVAANGETRLASVTIEQSGGRREIDCDFLACGFGLVPALELAGLLGCSTTEGRVAIDADGRTSVDGVWAAGESTGIGGVDKALAEGRIAGLSAAGMPATPGDRRALATSLAFAQLLAASFAPSPQLRTLCSPSTIVCRCEDVSAGEVAGYADWRSAKLQTRVGMGPCQGRVCGSACAFLYGWSDAAARPPVFPATAATLASVELTI